VDALHTLCFHSMASHGNNSTYSGQGKRTSFGAFSGANASMFLEKAKPGIRGSTPDSEALASSDDEQDQHHRLHTVTSSSFAPKPARRGSWLTEVQQPPQRKSSLNGCGPFSPSSPHPASTSGDQTSWSANQPSGGRGHSSSTSFPWGSAIWNNDSQKGPPLRLTEVLPSPTSTIPPNGLYSEDPLLSPPIGRENATESSIPFAIPLHPTLKTYRSQSYSVGQLDPEMTNGLPTNYGGPSFNGRPRTGSSYAGLQHRPSRPSMLGELSRDALGQLREVEDDESSNGSESGGHLSTAQARTIEQLAMENAILRQAAADQIEGNNIRNRTLTATSNTSGRNTFHGNQRIRGSVPEEADYALYDPEDTNTSQLYDHEGVSWSVPMEYGAKLALQYSAAGIPENRTLESVKKGHWQSSLGFGGVGEPPQSRRHSFADVPTRQTSISSTGETQNGFVATENGVRAGGRLGSPAGYGDGLVRPSQGEGSEYTQFRLRQVQEKILELEHLRDRNFAASYFAGVDASLRNADVHRPSMSPTTLHQAYTMHVPYGRSQHNGHSQPRPNQLLYVVTFKAYRAEVFYVQEGTGLQVKPGDLVIVEADRGTDLGTVAQENVPWNRAKEMKEHYIEEHYRWLMMFSRHGQNGTTSALNPNGQGLPSNGAQTSAVGGMGGPNAQAGVQDIPNQELKPKMIKRLAQAHEIQTLKDKEGNEAKAKRVCQQKVVEHRLNMEILDAEFQM